MPDTRPARQRRSTLAERLLQLVRRRVWGMDIDPTARIAGSALIDRTYPKGIHIGADCVIGEQVVVLTHDRTRGLYVHTRIGARTVVGARAIVLPGVTVGEDCEIAPGALVRTDMPDRSRAIGNPAAVSPR